MDDSDEEYMARGAEFAKKLFAEYENLEESRKEDVPGESGAPNTSEMAISRALEERQNRPAEKRAAPVVPFRIRIPLEPQTSCSTSSRRSEYVQRIAIPSEISTENQEVSRMSGENSTNQLACPAAPKAKKRMELIRLPFPDDIAQSTVGLPSKAIKPTRLTIPEPCSAAPVAIVRKTITPKEPIRLPERCSIVQNRDPLSNSSRQSGTDNQKVPRDLKLDNRRETTTVAPPTRLPTSESSSIALAPSSSSSRQRGSVTSTSAPKIPTDNQKASKVSEKYLKIEKCGETTTAAPSIRLPTPESCSIALNQAPSRQIDSKMATVVLPPKSVKPIRLPTPESSRQNHALLSSPSRQSEFDEQIQSTSTPRDKQEAPMPPGGDYIELQKSTNQNSKKESEERNAVVPPVNANKPIRVLPPKARRASEPIEPSNNPARQTDHVKSINIPKVPEVNQQNSRAPEGNSVPAAVQNIPAETPQNRPVAQSETVNPRIPKSRVSVPPPETRRKIALDHLEGSQKALQQPLRKQPASQPAPRAPCVQRPLLRSMRTPAQEQPIVPASRPARNPRQNHRPSDIIPVRVRQIIPHGYPSVRAQQRSPVVANRPSQTALGRHVPSRTNMMTVEPQVMPILGTSSPVDDQTTWMEEVPSTVSPITDNSSFDPDESILAASSSLDPSIIEPLDPERHEYPPMFAALTREFAERDRMNQENQQQQQNHQETRRVVSVLNLNGEVVHLNLNARPDNNTPDLSPYMMANYRGTFDESVYRAPDIEEPRMSVEPRARLLPPIAKGKLSTRPVVHVAMVDPVGMGSGQGHTNVHQHLDAFEPVPHNIEPLRSSTPQSVESVELPSEDSSYLSNLTPEDLADKSEKEILDITNQFYYSGPYQKFRANYPFLAEGIVQKDCETGELKVYSQRVGKIMIEDTRQKRDDDYVYFIVVSPGVYRGFSFYKHPNCLISAKFPKFDQIVLRGYAILAHPVGPREESMKDNHWVCWNDSLGVMSIIKGSALIPFKKYPVWDKQLDIISFKAGFQNQRFVVEQVVVLTNLREKQEHFPQEAFLVTDARWSGDGDVDLEFYSNTIKAPIYIKKMLVGTVDYHENRAFELVVVPTFPGMTNPQFRGLLIISMSCTFWSKDKEWIRKRLVDRAQAYRC